MTYASLHTHSEHSELDSTAKLSDLFKLTADLGQTALAITDHGTLGGLWKAQAAADRNGVKLIPGLEAYLAIGSRFERNTLEVDGDFEDDENDSAETEDGGPKARRKTKKYEHITLLAESEEGWRNLVAIANASQETKWGKYPRIDYQLIREHAAGIIVLTGCLGGPVLGPLSRGDVAEADANLLTIIDAVGAANVYVEVMEHGIEIETAILPQAAELAAKHSVALVATNDSHHTHAADATVHDAWLAVSTGALVADAKRYRFTGTGFHHRSEQEMLELRTELWWAEAVANTGLVADRVAERVLPLPAPRLPAFPTPDGFESNKAFFKHLVSEGAIAHYGVLQERPDVLARLNEELHIIRDMGFIDYFLIVHEVVSWSRENEILVGPGRGSAAGSLIAYCLGITGICPLENNLLFERFLEPGRPDFPDIDIDFESGRRQDVLDHLEDRWGKRSVSLIGSFSSSKTKRALLDAARVLDAGNLGRTLSKVVPDDGGTPFSFDKLFDDGVAAAAEFRNQVRAGGELAARVVELARGFDNTVNGASIHACGVIISDLDLTDLIPQRIDPKTGRRVSAWDSKDIESFGLLKLDILSLRNLDVVSQAIAFIGETTGEIVDFDRMPHPNTKGNPRVDAAWSLIRDGRLAGIFQMESASMTGLARQVQPSTLTDLSAVLALFRPGPLSAGMDQRFAKRKNHQEAIDYGIYTSDAIEADLIASVLGETYGAFVFQEQLMNLGRVMAGFDAATRGMLRKAVGKKDQEKMTAVGKLFVAGCTQEIRDPETGQITKIAFRQETAERMWEQMKGSGSYLFNASHSAAYAQVAYITAFLKANWPAEYGAAILAVTDDDSKRTQALRALPQDGVLILGPDVNRSGARSRPEGASSVRLGLSEIKGVGVSGELIELVREASGTLFTSLHDVVEQVRKGGLQKPGEEDMSYLPANHIEGLIEAGAFDDFGPRMGLLTIARTAKSSPNLGVPGVEWGFLERSARQRQRLLVSLGEHPLVRLQEDVRNWRATSVGRGIALETAAIPICDVPDADGTTVTTIGVLARYSEKAYKSGRLANITLEDADASIDGVLWDRTLTQTKNAGVMPHLGGLMAVTARVTMREFEQEDDDGVVTTTTSTELTVMQVYGVPVNDPVQGGFDAEAATRIAFATAGAPVAASAAPTLTVVEAPAPTYQAPTEPSLSAAVQSPIAAVAPAEQVTAEADEAEAFARETAAQLAKSHAMFAAFKTRNAVTITCKPNTPAARAARGWDVTDEFRRRLRETGGTKPTFNSHPSMVGTTYEVVLDDKTTVIGYVRIEE